LGVFFSLKLVLNKRCSLVCGSNHL